MKRTEVNIFSNFPKLEVENRSVFLGSCFSDNIGALFQKHKLSALVNPLGVVFHPIALFKLIDRALNNNFFEDTDFFEYQDYWFCYELSGSCAEFDKEETVKTVNNLLKELKQELLHANNLFLTFGSAVARSINGDVVANCHKQPSSYFEKTITASSEIEKKARETIEILLNQNPGLNISLSVSPVIHSKEGMVENSVSKSNLIIACYELSQQHNSVEYLPIYEIVKDELRDYAFYKNDLVHPNQNAVEVIWNRLISIKGSVELNNYIKLSNQILKSLGHKSLYPKSGLNILFLQNLLASIEAVEAKYPISWLTEREVVKNQLKELA